MKIFVLIVMMHVNSGGIVNFQEFTSLEKCQYAAQLINQRSYAAVSSSADAFCVVKQEKV